MIKNWKKVEVWQSFYLTLEDCKLTERKFCGFLFLRFYLTLEDCKYFESSVTGDNLKVFI